MTADVHMTAPLSSPSAPADDPADRTTRDFSMVLGGPLYQLFLRARIIRPPLDLLRRRMVVISLLAWLPLLILSLIDGRAWGGTKVPFLWDVSVYARFLVSLPLLILAEWLVHIRFRPMIEQFLARDIIRPAEREKFARIVESSRRLRNSVVAEVILLIVVFTGGQFLWRNQGALHVSAWYGDQTAEGLRLTMAGMCYAFWSLPVYQFILFRWYFRVFIWTRFLWKVSKLKLNLVPTHPDCAGGLGFLAGSAHAMMPLLFAQGATVAGVIANRIFFQGARLPQFKIEILILVLFCVVLALGPLLVFIPVLMRCQRIGNREYGQLASRYVGDFDKKWLRGGADPNEMLGTGDIQSLADLNNSFDVIRSMQPLPFGKGLVLRVALMSALPLAPLVLTVIPFEELIDRLFKMVL